MARAARTAKAPKSAATQPKPSRNARGLRVLMIASEAQPFSKTGGLADVATALPRALGRLGHDVTVVTPRYRGIEDGPIAAKVSVEVAAHRFDTRLIEKPIGPGARAMLVECPELYDRAGIYYENGIDYPDNAVRYAVL